MAMRMGVLVTLNADCDGLSVAFERLFVSCLGTICLPKKYTLL
jgi:hypothetical protein